MNSCVSRRINSPANVVANVFLYFTLFFALTPDALAIIKGVDLLEPLPNGVTSISVNSGDCNLNLALCPLATLNQYLQPFIPFIVGLSAGIAVLMIVIGGVQMIFAGGDQAKFGNGKTRVVDSLIGLILLVFSAAILNLLNANFFHLI